MVDPELIAYLDQRFRESAEQTEALRQETAQQFAAVRAETAELRQEMTQQFTAVRAEAAEFRQETTQQFAAVRAEAAEFRQETAQRFTAVSTETAELRQETTQRFQQVDETARHTLVLVEGLRGDIELLAEGFGGLNERLERIQKEVTLLPGQIKVGIEPFLKNLDGRVRILEGRAEIRQPGPQA
jgi:soluble lytic murein transglycosylase-like protein